MAVASSERVWLGNGDDLDQFGVGMQRPASLASLSAAGIRKVEGLAIDDVAGTLLVADGDGEIVEIRLEALEN